VPYEIVARAVEKYPGRFYGMAGIDPYEGMNGVRALEDAVKNMGFIGAHVYPHWFDLAAGPCQVLPVLREVRRARRADPDAGRAVDGVLEGRADAQRRSAHHSRCRGLRLPGTEADRHPRRHPWTEEMIAMAWKHDNVFIGSDAHSPKYWPQSFVNYINTYGQDKVMFGTDYPVLGFRRTMDEVLGLNLRPDPLRKFLRDNALRVYGIQ
jgi:uncharacterized protein